MDTRFHLQSVDQIRREFPRTWSRTIELAEALPSELVNELAERAAPAFSWRPDDPVEPLGSDEVRFSVALSLSLLGLDYGSISEMNADRLQGLASEYPWIGRNHVIGAAFFDKPVAPPDDWTSVFSGIDDEGGSGDVPTGQLQEFLLTDAGHSLLQALARLLRGGGDPGGPQATA